MWKPNKNTTHGMIAAVSAGFLIILASSAARMQTQISHESTINLVSTQSRAMTVPMPQNNYPQPIAMPVQGTDSDITSTPEYGTYGRPVDIPGVTYTQDNATEINYDDDQSSLLNNQGYDMPGSEEDPNTYTTDDYQQTGYGEELQDPEQIETSEPAETESVDNY